MIPQAQVQLFIHLDHFLAEQAKVPGRVNSQLAGIQSAGFPITYVISGNSTEFDAYARESGIFPPTFLAAKDGIHVRSNPLGMSSATQKTPLATIEDIMYATVNYAISPDPTFLGRFERPMRLIPQDGPDGLHGLLYQFWDHCDYLEDHPISRRQATTHAAMHSQHWSGAEDKNKKAYIVI